MSVISAATNVVILLGPPGAGKGSQAALLKEKISMPHISTGDLLRQNIAKDTELGKKAKIFMEKGELVPDELIIDMLFARVSESDCTKGYILDGFPRTIPQAEAFEARLEKEDSIKAINLTVSDEAILERISGRIICKECQTPYHISFSPPKEASKCDHCKGELIQRKDDKPDVIKSRLSVYRDQTEPLIEYYQKKKKLHNISCQKPKDQVLTEILNSLA